MRSGGVNRPVRQRGGSGSRLRKPSRAGTETSSRLRRLADGAGDQAGQRDVANAALYRDVRRLIADVGELLSMHRAEGVPEVLERLGQQDLGEAAFREPTPNRQPVLSHLPHCLAEVGQLHPVLASHLSVLEASLQWHRSPAYTDLIMGSGFNANYGWTHVIGPHGFFPGDDFVMGILMLGPDRHYPDRYQPAPELCWPLTEESFWSRDGKPFFAKQQGTPIWHPSMAPHATMTGASPLLALWFRTRDTATPTRLRWS